MEVPQKLKIGLSYDPAIPLLGIYPKEIKSLSVRDICSPLPMFTTVSFKTLFKIAKTWKQPKCPPTDEWIKKIYIYTSMHIHTYIHNGILFSHEKEGNPAICDKMDRL